VDGPTGSAQGPQDDESAADSTRPEDGKGSLEERPVSQPNESFGSLVKPDDGIPGERSALQPTPACPSSGLTSEPDFPGTSW